RRRRAESGDDQRARHAGRRCAGGCRSADEERRRGRGQGPRTVQSADSARRGHRAQVLAPGTMTMRRTPIVLLACISLLVVCSGPKPGATGVQSGTSAVKALVAGTLVGGSAAPPARNTVVIIKGARSKPVGQFGRLAAPA